MKSRVVFKHIPVLNSINRDPTQFDFLIMSIVNCSLIILFNTEYLVNEHWEGFSTEFAKYLTDFPPNLPGKLTLNLTTARNINTKTSCTLIPQP